MAESPSAPSGAEGERCPLGQGSRGGVQCLDCEAGGRLVAGHERLDLGTRNHVVDVVEHPAAALIDRAQNRHRTSFPVAQHEAEMSS